MTVTVPPACKDERDLKFSVKGVVKPGGRGDFKLPKGWIKKVLGRKSFKVMLAMRKGFWWYILFSVEIFHN